MPFYELWILTIYETKLRILLLTATEISCMENSQNQSVCLCVHVYVCVCVCVCTQSCSTLCYPMYCNLPGSSVHGIFQEKLLKQFPTPGDFAYPGIESKFLGSPELAGRFFITLPNGKSSEWET